MPLQRRLAAILVCDIVGFSRMMRDHEGDTYLRLKRFKSDVVLPGLAAHGGRLVKDTGDGFLAIFDSAVHAVECAVALQTRMGEAGSGPADEFRLRAGVHIGDIIVEGSDVYGDGVNVAARLEALSAPGAVAMSDAIFDQVQDKLKIKVEDLGPQSLKNIDRPVRVWMWTGATAVGSGPIPPVGDREDSEKPSIAVLAFANMSRDPEQEFFADGIAEDIITALSRIERFFVVARTSSFSFKGQSVDVQEIGRLLGVRYVLEGSVRAAGDRLRVTAQFIDATTGSHIWAEKYDRTWEDLFEIQDEITRNVVASVQTQIDLHEGKQVAPAERMSLPVRKLVSMADACTYKMDAESLHQAVEYAEQALELDPRSGAASQVLSSALLHIAFLTDAEDPQTLCQRALQLAEQAVRYDPNDEYSYWSRGTVRTFMGAHESAIADLERAIEINPNCSLAWGCLGFVQALVGMPDEGIGALQLAIRSNPRDPTNFFRFSDLALAHFLLADYAQAEAWARKAVQRKPDFVQGHFLLIASVQAQGRAEDAQAAVSELGRICGPVPLKRAVYIHLIRRKEDREFALALLKEAGLR